MDRQKEIEQIEAAIKTAYGYIEKADFMLKELKATPEPKEPETWEEIVKAIEPQFKTLCNCLNAEQSLQIQNFAKRLLIADYCGRREFVKGQDNWYNYYRVDVDKWEVISATATIKYGVNHFPTKEAAEKYLNICLNSNLL